MKGILEEKSFQFSIRLIDLYRFLIEEKKEFIISKMTISLKEASETRYWLRLLKATNTITEEQFKDIIADCNELINILVASCKSAKNI